jgi:hypothetical protein
MPHHRGHYRSASILGIAVAVLLVVSSGAFAGVSFSSPSNGATVSGTVTVQLNPASGTSWSNWYLDGNYQGSTPPTSFSWQTGNVSNGTHQLTATAFSSNGSSLGSGSVTVTVANGGASSSTNGPVAITSPGNGSSVSGNTSINLALSGSASWANLYIDGVYANSTPPSSFTWGTTGVSNGTHQISAIGFSSNGSNLGTSTISVNVSNGSSVSSSGSGSSAVSFTSPSSGSTVSGSVNVAYSMGSGTAWVNLYVDGSYLSSSPPSSVNWSSTSVSNGSHTLSAKAFNASGSNVGTATLALNVSNSGSSSSSGGSSGSSSGHFSTLLPGSSLPSSSTCASQVRRNGFEPRPDNYTANHTIPSSVSAAQNASNLGGAPSGWYNRVDGNFTGTTDEILQWGACKWGFDEDLVRAIAATESWWRQPAAGDITYNTSLCPSGAVWNGSGCYLTYGILQIKSTDFGGTFPNSHESTAFAIDYKLANQRACYEGKVSYLSSRSSDYPSSSSYDMLWGCVDQWFTGGWWSGSNDAYLNEVQDHMANKPWLNSGF